MENSRNKDFRKIRSFKKEWRDWEMSQHLPLWLLHGAGAWLPVLIRATE